MGVVWVVCGCCAGAVWVLCGCGAGAEAGRSIEEETDTSPGAHPEGTEENTPGRTFTSTSHSPTGPRARYLSDEDVYVAPSPSVSPAKRIKEAKELSSLEV